jgi:hypothetical protein
MVVYQSASSGDENPTLSTLLQRLAELARMGPIPAVTSGDTAVGITMLDALGIAHTSSSKSMFEGIAISARRRAVGAKGNRVNLFAQVPDWSISSCKSSREIVQRHGYETDRGTRRLYCTIRSRRANSQGLVLEVDRPSNQLNELVLDESDSQPVASWKLAKLQERLVEAHPQSMWVRAVPSERAGVEYFHYREASYSGAPKSEELPFLLDQGTVTLDHLIEDTRGRVIEKGPLFKISPSNFELLFPAPRKYDLLSYTG